MPMAFLGACLGKLAQLVPVVVVVGKGPKLKKVPDAMVREFDFRSPADVAGK